ncbi:MAG: hypothetical protein KY391_03785 [Actinobacteria bacterium]|nr:hypothetical protein [Actinomycetota bacterium]
MKRIATALVATILLVAACADSEDQPDHPVVQDPGSHKETSADHEKRTNDKKAKKPSGKGRPGTANKKSSADNSKDGLTVDNDDGSSTGDGGSDGGSDGGVTAKYPAAGRYTFAQSGYEEFCDTAGNCDKQRLPSRQPVKLTYQSRRGSSAVVVSKQKASRSRSVSTWTEFTPSGARITKVHVEFNYSGFGFERTYVPDPPVRALWFPIQSGTGWSGRWEASTSGSYDVVVGDRRNVKAGSRSVAAFPVETTTEFRGDFEGKSRITTYVDPRTNTIVAAKGVLNVTSQFGRYTTSFDTRLVDGPRY